VRLLACIGNEERKKYLPEYSDLVVKLQNVNPSNYSLSADYEQSSRPVAKLEQ
jgi:hypothetical protein